jgi:hypothetical protein
VLSFTAGAAILIHIGVVLAHCAKILDAHEVPYVHKRHFGERRALCGLEIIKHVEYPDASLAVETCNTDGSVL